MGGPLWSSLWWTIIGHVLLIQTAGAVSCDIGDYLIDGDCTTCPSGHYCSGDAKFSCPAGKFNNRLSQASIDSCLDCPRSKYSRSGSILCSSCPAGKYCPSSGTSIPTDCEKGHYSTGGASACTICPAGYSCTAATSPVVCNKGEYSPLGSMDCTPCRAGYYCPSRAGAEKECSRGSYSMAGQSSCTQCPPGHYCPENLAKVAIPCPENTYAREGSATCTVCPEGYSCTTSTYPVVCEYGEFSPLGSMDCTPCRPGYYCPYKAGAELECPRGSYSLKRQSSCTDCPAGYYCPTAKSDSFIPCPENTYSTDESSSCTICPEGYSCHASKLLVVCEYGEFSPTGSTDCTKCSPGYYCPYKAGTETECPRGMYSLEGQKTCTKCPAGHYCPETGANFTIPCPESTYSTAGASSCTICPQGYSCSASLSPVICKDGEYSPAGSMDCTQCRPGYYCPYKAGAEIECPRAKYSLAGQKVCTNCPAGHYCPETGANYTIPCPESTYSTAGASSCTICPQGYSCSASLSPVICKDGEYSPAGSMDCTQCRPGYYCPYKAGAEIECPRAKYSLAGQKVCTNCPAGHYCPETGANYTIPCPENTYSTGQASSCIICPKGYSCRSSMSPVVCKYGEYSPVGSMDCTQCRPGYYCPYTAEAEIECPRGKYSLAGQKDCTNCPAGNYCPEAGANYTIPCPENTYSTGQASSCIICPEGFSCSSSKPPVVCNYGEYSPVGSMDCTQCRPGYYCPYKAGAEIECPRGKYSLAGQKDCTNCPAGYYCPESGAIYATACPENTYSTGKASSCIICQEGYSCRSSMSPVVCNYGEYSPVGSMDCTRCRPGYYCPYKSGAEIECPRGKYSLAGQKDCTNCPAGHYCPEAGANYTIPCPENTYSTGQASSCIICPEGYSCRSSMSPVICNNGEYSPAGSMKCTRCNPGYYCPYKAGAPLTCLRGTYSLGGATKCLNCPPGTYCSSDATSIINCPENTYSTGNANTCTICPAGFSCTPSTSPVSCRNGEYSPLGSMICSQCRPGTYCVRQAAAEMPCPEGHFSSAGQMSCTPCEDMSACSAQLTTIAATPQPSTVSTTRKQINCGFGYCYQWQSQSCVPCTAAVSTCSKIAKEGMSYTIQQNIQSLKGDRFQWKIESNNNALSSTTVTTCSINTLICESIDFSLYRSTIESGDGGNAFDVTLTIVRIDRQQNEATLSLYDDSSSPLKSCSLEVFYPPSASPVMTISNDDTNNKNVALTLNNAETVSLNDGQRVLVKCQVYGGNPVVSDVTITCMDLSTKVSDVVATQKWKADMTMNQGKCVCSATHVTGSYLLTSEFTISILYAPTITTLTANSQTGNVEVVNGQDVVLNCGADGYPSPRMSIMGQRTKEYVTLQKLNPMGDLTSQWQVRIRAQCTDTDTYVCMAGNNLGSMEASILLNVKCSPELLSNEMIREFIPNADGDLEIKIPIIGFPAPTDFTLALEEQNGGRGKRDANQWNSDLRGSLYKVTFIDDGSPKGEVVLKMFGLSGGDSGQYILLIKNGIGDGLHYYFTVTVLTGNETCSRTNEATSSESNESDLVVIIIICAVAVILCITTFIIGWKVGQRKAKEKKRRDQTLILNTTPDYSGAPSQKAYDASNINQPQHQSQNESNDDDILCRPIGFTNTNFITSREPEEVDDKNSEYYVELDSCDISFPDSNRGIETRQRLDVPVSKNKRARNRPKMAEPLPEYVEADEPSLKPGSHYINEFEISSPMTETSSGYEIPSASHMIHNSSDRIKEKRNNEYVEACSHPTY